jgi:hypothetical protein
MLGTFCDICGNHDNLAEVLRRTMIEFRVLLTEDYFPQKYPKRFINKLGTDYIRVRRFFEGWTPKYTLYLWSLVHRLGELSGSDGAIERSLAGLDEYLVARQIEQALRTASFPETDIERSLVLLRVLTAHAGWGRVGHIAEAVDEFLRDANVRIFLQVNRHRDVLWFNHECFMELAQWLFAIGLIDIETIDDETAVQRVHSLYTSMQEAEEASGYEVEKLVSALRGEDTE